MRPLTKTIDAVASGRRFYLTLGVILLIALILRVLFLNADPPMGLTRSQDFSTDPFQYVYFGKNVIDHGTSNPYNDWRLPQWEKSSETLISMIVFAITGTGRAQGNLVGVLFNLASILLLALAMKNFGSRVAALFFAVIAVFDFTLIWFARTPFLEGSQNFWICLSIYFFSRGTAKSFHFILAGLACATAALFGKMIALFMVAVFAGIFLLQFLNDSASRRQTVHTAVRFGIGFAITALFWLFYIYLPSRGGVSSYVVEQALGLYGAPKALDSLKDFFWQLISVLWESEFFEKMPLVTILAFLSGAGLLTAFAKRKHGGRLFGELNIGWLLLLLWFAIGYLSLFPWNYRPLRYQTTLMIPAMALAAVSLAYVFGRDRQTPEPSEKKKRQSAQEHNLWPLAIIWGLWLLPFFGLIVLWIGSFQGTRSVESSMRQGSVKFAVLFFVLGGLAGIAYRVSAKSGRNMRGTLSWIAAASVVFFVVFGVAKFVNWSGVRQYTLLTADRDLGAIVNKGAVISGPYAPAVTQENGLGCVLHMFSVWRSHHELFEKLPITHLIMDEGNEKLAREDYPEIMDKMNFVTRYFIRGVQVMVYDISNATTNPTARQYFPTDYEMAQRFITQKNDDSAQFYMRRFLENGPPNYSAEFYVADALNSAGNYGEALKHYTKVQQFAPGDALSSYTLGYCYLTYGGEQQNAAYFDSALTYLTIARTLFSQDKKLAETVEQLERRKR